MSSEIFQSALAAHRAGKFNDAEQGYLQVLRHDADNADACHMLGTVLEQQGRAHDAENWMRKALTLREDARYLCDLGVMLWKSRRIAEAESALIRAIALSPEFSPAVYNLAYQYMNAGRIREAQVQLIRVIAMQPDFMPAYYMLGMLLHQSQQADRAEDAFRQVLILVPEQADANHMLALIHRERRDLIRAEVFLRRALMVREDTAFLCHLGNLLSESARHADAQACFRRALVLDPGLIDVLYNFGNSLGAMQNPAEAELSYRRALAIDPGFAEANLNLGLLLQDSWRLQEAQACYRRALDTRPMFVEAIINLGEALKLSHRQQEAEVQLKIALTIDPAFVEAHSNLGVLYNETGRRDESEICYLRALVSDPGHASTHANLGHLFQERHLMEEAEAFYQQALQLDANDTKTQFNYATFLLLSGDFERGWRAYESRWNTKESDGIPPFAQPRWLGDADLRGKTILLYAEQGLGDTLQFGRYANLLKVWGATVWMLVPSQLKSLMASCAGVAGALTYGEPLPHFDYHSPLMSLPLACRTSLQTIPSEIPYLAASPAAIAHWRERLGVNTVLRVGLVWSGAPRRDQPAAHVLDRQRSMHFNRMLPLLDVENVEFYSLQLGDEAKQQIQAHSRLIDHTADLHDFADTAALVANLDLVICVDTSVAHLTGAVGKPFWLLNRYNTCSRWLLDREDSPWYPTARIFRQPQLGDWDSVIVHVKRALEELVRARK